MKMFILYLLLGSSMFLQAQTNFLGARIALGSAVGPFTFGSMNPDNFTNKSFGSPLLGLGIGFEYNHELKNRIHVGASIDYSYFGISSYTGVDQSPFTTNYYSFKSTSHFIPVAASIKYLVSEQKSSFYIGMSAGFAFVVQNKDLLDISGELDEIEFWTQNKQLSWSQHGFFVQPKIGIISRPSQKLLIDFGLRYTAVFNHIDGDHAVDFTSNDGQQSQETFKDWVSDPTRFLELFVGLHFSLSK
jgi:hypothetical protein